MNMHMPQDDESSMELRMLAAVPRQIVSPQNNASIVGIFQDSLLGSYRITRPHIEFTPREAMNLLMKNDKVNPMMFKDPKQNISVFKVLSQILPPLTSKFKNGSFGDDDDARTSNRVVEIINGEMKRGQLDKGVKRLLHSIYNDFGYNASSDFIDDLQNIVTEYMKSSSYSVGISDLLADDETNRQITTSITKKKQDVINLIDQVKIGVFENNTGKSNNEEFETCVNSILNKAQEEAGKIGRKSLSEDNRFKIMVEAGSKGSNLNIAQMISCLGQQNVDGKRIPYGFEDRTLPHYNRFDDSPEARGFVGSSFIQGLTPQEMFFHAMGGRVGLIDTAVKTSETGYLQRRLIKGMEDLKVEYDMTVRNNVGKVIQFKYGEDSIDTTKVENQRLPLVSMTLEEIYAHYTMPDDAMTDSIYTTNYTSGAITRMKKEQNELNKENKNMIDKMVRYRDETVKRVFNNTNESTIHIPVHFERIIGNVKHQLHIQPSSMVDITPLECYNIIKMYFKNMRPEPTRLFEAAYYYYLSPKELLMTHRFNRKALIALCETITTNYKRAVIAPGEMVGMVAAQSIGEPTTQMSALYTEKMRIVKVSKETSEKTFINAQFGEFVDNLIKKYPEFTFNTGHEDSVETLLECDEHEYYIIGVDSGENTKWNKISHVSKHPVNGRLIEVTTRSGRKVVTTASHSHLKRDKDTQTVMPIVAADLKPGMRIPSLRTIENNFVNKSIQIDGSTYELDSEFGFFIGAYLAEGSINGNSIKITNINDEYSQKCIDFAVSNGLEYSVNKYQGEYGPSMDTNIKSKNLKTVIETNCGKGSYNKRIPPFAFTAPTEFVSSLIQGFMDGDGNIQCSDNHNYIRACSRSKQLTRDFGILLNYVGIFCNFTEEQKQGKPFYNFVISNKYAKQYSEMVGSITHKEKLELLVSYTTRKAYSLREDIDMIPGVGEIIAYCGKRLSIPNHSRNYGRWSKKDNIGRRTLEKYINVFEAHEQKELITKELNILKQAESSGVVWDEIIDIKDYDKNECKYVYDFTVPESQTFMTNDGVIIHNTLNTFHFAGVSSKSNVTRGVPRIKEILSLSKNPKNPSVTVALKGEHKYDKSKAQQVRHFIEHTSLRDIVESVTICYDPDNLTSLIEEDEELVSQYKEFETMVKECAPDDGSEEAFANWVIRFEMDKEEMLEKNITMDDVHFALTNSYKDEIQCVFSDYNADKLIFRVRLLDSYMKKIESKKAKPDNILGSDQAPLDQSDEIYMLKNLQENLLDNIVLRGIKNIGKVIMRKVQDKVVKEEGKFTTKESWVLDTVGTNLLDILGMDEIDFSETVTNDIIETYNVLGIEAARQIVFNELTEVIEFGGTYVNYHHLDILCDRMACNESLVAISRHGINNDNIHPIAKASFEETPEMFLQAARHAEMDNMRGVSSNVMVGQEGNFGTSAFQVVLDIKEMARLGAKSYRKKRTLEEEFGIENTEDACAVTNIKQTTNINVIQGKNIDDENDYNPGF
jgi:DNA-directed RNA polymerase beta' subunit